MRRLSVWRRCGDGDDGATFTPSVDSAGNLSWTNNKGLTNPPTVNIKGPKGDSGSGGGSSSGGGKEYVVVEPDFSPMGVEVIFTGMMPNKVFIVSEPITSLVVSSFVTTANEVDCYDIIFRTDQESYLSFPDLINIVWANGTLPTLEVATMYELSIQRVTNGGGDFYNAVLTPFKLI